VIVSDIRGALPLFGQGILALNDARKRFLDEQGRMIPERDKLFAALVEAPENYERIIAPWESVTGLDLKASTATCFEYDVQTAVQDGATDFGRERMACVGLFKWSESTASSALQFTCTRAGTVHGFALWFETKLFGEIGFCTQPGTKDSVYGQVFLPLLEPVKVAEGEKIWRRAARRSDRDRLRLALGI